MSNDEAASGRRNSFGPVYETRRIILAEGAEFHHSDIVARGNGRLSTMTWLDGQLGDFEKHSDTEGEYTNDDQKVHYTIEIIASKDEFRRALETEDVHVIYSGHSRYGRGACFDLYPETVEEQGEQWGNGDESLEELMEDNRDLDFLVEEEGMPQVQHEGLFRLGYPYVPVPIRDIRKHQYRFAPVAVEEGAPAGADRHPNARRRLRRIPLPDDVQQYLIPEYESESGYYLGVQKGGYGNGVETNVLLRAGWDGTQTRPYDLGSTELACKVFCHFGCSSAKHFWPIVRRTRYKGWGRPTPPTDRFAYFTRRPSNIYARLFWLFYLLAYPEQNNDDPWWDSLEYAKRNANRRLRVDGWSFRIY